MIFGYLIGYVSGRNLTDRVYFHSVYTLSGAVLTKVYPVGCSFDESLFAHRTHLAHKHDCVARILQAKTAARQNIRI